MGKGDKKTRKGKIYAGSHGNVRPRSTTAKPAAKDVAGGAGKPAPRAPAKPAARPAAKKAPAKKTAPKKSA